MEVGETRELCEGRWVNCEKSVWWKIDGPWGQIAMKDFSDVGGKWGTHNKRLLSILKSESCKVVKRWNVDIRFMSGPWQSCVKVCGWRLKWLYQIFYILVIKTLF